MLALNRCAQSRQQAPVASWVTRHGNHSHAVTVTPGTLKQQAGPNHRKMKDNHALNIA